MQRYICIERGVASSLRLRVINHVDNVFPQVGGQEPAKGDLATVWPSVRQLRTSNRIRVIPYRVIRWFDIVDRTAVVVRTVRDDGTEIRQVRHCGIQGDHGTERKAVNL